jgi:hypothetical protein
MDLFFGIAFLVISFLFIFLIFVIKKETEDKEVVPAAVLGAMVATFFIGGIYLIDEYCSPSITPIDVYRGKTTLEITYRDSIAIDSIVVWKE